MKALYETLSEKNHVDVILGCSAWDSTEFNTPYRIQALYAGDDDENMALTVASYTTQLVSYLRMLRPDFAIIHGDRYEQLGAAIACSYMNIPIIHTEGGDYSGSIDGKVRWAISSLSDIHFPVTESAMYRLWGAFPSTDRVFSVGSTGIDLVRKWEETYVQKTHKYPYVLVLFHPDTVTKESIEPLIEAVLKECGSYHIKWVNANVDSGARAMMKEVHKYDVEFIKNVPPEEYFALMKEASLLIGNSSSFIKEAAYLGKRAVLVGSRQEGREVGCNVIRCPNTVESICEAIEIGLEVGDGNRDFRFGDGHACEKIQQAMDSICLMT